MSRGFLGGDLDVKTFRRRVLEGKAASDATKGTIEVGISLNRAWGVPRRFFAGLGRAVNHYLTEIKLVPRLGTRFRFDHIDADKLLWVHPHLGDSVIRRILHFSELCFDPLNLVQ